MKKDKNTKIDIINWWIEKKKINSEVDIKHGRNFILNNYKRKGNKRKYNWNIDRKGNKQYPI